MCYILRYKTFEESHKTLQIVIAPRYRYVITDTLYLSLVKSNEISSGGNIYGSNGNIHKYLRSFH